MSSLLWKLEMEHVKGWEQNGWRLDEQFTVETGDGKHIQG